MSFVLCASDVVAQFNAAQLRAVSRCGGQPGTEFEVKTVAGDRLDEVSKLWFSHPGITAELKTGDPLPFDSQRQPQFGQFIVSIAPDVPPGRYEVRAVGRHGISNPRVFTVTPLPNHPLPAGQSVTDASEVVVDTIVHGTTTPAAIAYYKFQLAEPRSVAIEVLAQRVDSRLIADLHLIDAKGRVLQSARGADEFDPMLMAEHLPAGTYTIAVNDFTFRGGPEYFFQLATHDPRSFLLPSVDRTHQLPIHSQVRSFTVGRDIETAMSSIAGVRGTVNTGADTVLVDRLVEVPAKFTGVFPSDHSDVEYVFAATKGDVFHFEVFSDRVGQPTDARLIVERIEVTKPDQQKLHRVLTSDDSQAVSDGAVNAASRDPVGLLTVPETAQYKVTLRDLDRGTSLSAKKRYLLQVGPPQPGFSLIAYRMFPHRDVNTSQPHGAKLFRGGSEVIRVLAVRRDGWNGPIHVSVEGLPQGVSAGKGIIAANQSQTQLTLTASDDAPASMAIVRVRGRSEDDAHQVDAVPVVIAWGKGGGRDFIQSRLSTGLAVSVSDVDLSPITIQLGSADVTEVKKGQSIKLPVSIIRRPGGQTPVILRQRDLPPGVSAPDVTIAADKSEGEYEFKVAGNAATGTYSLWLQGETKIKIKPNPQALEHAQRYRDHLQTLHDDPERASELDAIKAAIAEADKRIAAVKAAANDQELTAFIPSTNAIVRIVDP